MRIIKKNKIECLSCNKILESKHRHDFVNCGKDCTNETFVDGGKDYQRCGGKDLTLIKDMSEYELVLSNTFMSRHDFLILENIDDKFKDFSDIYYKACISITTTEAEKVKLHDQWRDSLQVVFKDVNDLTIPGAITKSLAEQIVSFIIDQSKTVKHIIIHCDMGVSRSAAIDLFIEEIIKGNTVEDIQKSKWCNYNRSVYNQLLKAYQEILDK